jgi:trimeric autotransporter adhesin
MTYSQLINIKSKKLEINYNFSINKYLKFRFITPENLNGIALNTRHEPIVNNSETYNEFWYRYTSDLEFTNLNKYRYLVLQLYSDEDYRYYQLQENDTFNITNKNDWFECCNNGSSCGINLFNQQIITEKPLQQVNEYLKYKITGDAKLIDNKYIKIGKYSNTVEINGFEPKSINYISHWKLKHLDNKIENPVKSVNKYTNINITHEDFNGINNINDKIEMIKFQLKNYFLENNKDIERLDTNIIKNDDKTNKLANNVYEIKCTLEKYVEEFEDIDKSLKQMYILFNEISKKFTPHEEKINSLFIITEDLIKAKNIFDKNISNIEKELIKIYQVHKDMNNRISKVTEHIDQDVIKIENDISCLRENLNKKIGNVNDKIDNNKINIDELYKNLTLEMKTSTHLIKHIDSKVDTNKLEFDTHISNYNKNINKNNENNDIIVQNISIISKKVNKLNEHNNSSKNKLNEIIKIINELSIMSNSFTEKLLEYELRIENNENKISTIDNKLETLIENKSSYIWSNKRDDDYIIECHQTYLSLNYNPNNTTYKTENLYIFKDKEGIIIPYYCWKIKHINNAIANVKFIALIPINNIV